MTGTIRHEETTLFDPAPYRHAAYLVPIAILALATGFDVWQNGSEGIPLFGKEVGVSEYGMGLAFAVGLIAKALIAFNFPMKKKVETVSIQTTKRQVEVTDEKEVGRKTDWK